MKPQSGNVLFYILIAIAMLAALSYAVSQSSRGGTSTLSEDRAKLYATDILDYSNSLSSAVAQLRLRGCAFSEISFDTPSLSLHRNNNAPSDGSCDVFGPSGGGLSYKSPSDLMGTSSEWSFTYENNVDGFGNTCSDTSCKDMVGFITDLPLEVCEAINDKTGLSNPPPEEGDNLYNHRLNNEYDSLVIAGLNLDGPPVDTPINSGCINLTKLNDTDVGDVYYFYVVLWAQY